MSNLIDSHVSVKQSKLAIDALLKHAAKVQAEQDETELLGAKDELVWLNVNVKRIHPEKKLKPFSIPLARPIVDPRTSPICLITKDPQREYKDLLAAQNIKFVSRVVGVTKLKGKFKPFEARRQLLKDHGLFLADDRVVPLLPKLLGKMFFEAKKQPIPVNLQRKDLKAELERAVSSTYMHQNQGTCTSIKIAPISFTPAQVLENLAIALPNVVKHIKGGWDNVQSLNIKTNTSVSLPIWSCELGSGEGGRWAGMVGTSEESAESSESEEEEEAVPVMKEGKKRAAPSTSAAMASKKAKGSSSEALKTTQSTAPSVPALSIPKPALAATISKPVSTTASTSTKKQPKKAIPRTPVVEESDSDDEPVPAPKAVSKAKPAVVAGAKKRAMVASIEQKKAKILAAKGTAKRGSKAKIFGSK
ncbi:ribosomal protein L1p/L10e family [Ceratobasidium sp. AG-Ba]|nr:ribosomal protein L1p/L10e family [Ceratobasidium sp. AG-Ba]QRW06568.1 ribosomal protein L1p/L10e family [Ceratobasidium sp. AG-Ba]